MNEQTIVSASATDVGKVRLENQDAMGIFEPVDPDCPDCLYLVCDGMGGYQGGKIAGQAVVDALAQTYRGIPEGASVPAVLQAAVRQAHLEVQLLAGQDRSLAEMGTTLALLLIHAGEAWVANVGDSRVYLVREGQIRQLSVDHSQVAFMLERGLLTQDQAAQSTRRNILTRALKATDSPVQAEISSLPLQSGDTFILCSDGLWGKVDNEKIRTVVQTLPAQKAAQRLIDLANQAGGEDNISVILVKYGQAAQLQPVPSRSIRTGTLLKSPWFWGPFLAILLAGIILGAVAVFLLLK